MFKFVGGRPAVLTFSQVEALYYASFIKRFPESVVSISQWRGSYEYQCIYPDIQMLVENGAIMNDSLDKVMGTIADENMAIYRPASLMTRVPERFAQAGYEATIRRPDATTKGVVALCVDQKRTPNTKAILTAAADGAGHVGWDTGLYGDLTPSTAYGRQLVEFWASSAYQDMIILSFTESFSISEMKVSVDGIIYDVVPFQGVQPTEKYRIYDAYLYNTIMAGDGVQFSLEWMDGASINNDDQTIAELIRDELLPAGQLMEGDITYQTALSNGQAITIKWTTPVDLIASFKVTLTRSRNSPHPTDTPETVIEKFMAEYNRRMGLGMDITPDLYLSPFMVPWAASIVTECDPLGGAAFAPGIVQTSFNQRYAAVLLPENVVIV